MLSCPLQLNNNSWHSDQSSSQRCDLNTHRRSRSPQHKRSCSREQLNHRQHCLTDRQDQVFSHGTNPKAHPICAICLGTHVHNVYACNTARSWDGQHATMARRYRGDLHLRENDTPLCMDWQRLQSCNSIKHNPKHLCSGCGMVSHGAHRCP